MREAALASFLAPFASAALVVAVSLVWQSIYVAGALIAGLYFVLTSKRTPAGLGAGSRLNHSQQHGTEFRGGRVS